MNAFPITGVIKFAERIDLYIFCLARSLVSFLIIQSGEPFIAQNIIQCIVCIIAD